MKKLLIILLSAFTMTIIAEEAQIALLQPLTVPGSTACNAMEVSMVRGELRKALGWQSNFQVLTRMDIDAMLNEMGFQQSGMVDDAQRKKIGVMTSAQYICISSITKYGTQLYIEAYLVNVETGQMTNPATQYVNVKNEDYSTLPIACGQLAKEMLGEISGSLVKSHIENSGIFPRQPVNYDFTEDAWGINMKMIWVEGGEFMMGCTSEQGDDCWSNEKNVCHVKMDGFYIGMLEVTQSQWEKVMGTSIYQQSSKAVDANNKNTNGVGVDYPMYFISWEEATEFCSILSNKTGKTYTLPTEAQWEYAARGGDKSTRTKYSGSNLPDEVAWTRENSNHSAHQCGTKKMNELGIYDMSGNVREWCKDWYSYDNCYNVNNPIDPSYDERVHRGGSWYSGATCCCRVSERLGDSPSSRRNFIGFRVVLLP